MPINLFSIINHPYYFPTKNTKWLVIPNIPIMNGNMNGI